MLDLDSQLCFALYSASRAMVGTYDDVLEPLGLTYPQYITLLVLWEGDGLSVKQIGERLQLDSGTLTPMLKRLEAQGLITRSRNSEDERVLDVFLTAAGHAMKARCAEFPITMLCRTGLDLDALISLREQLHSLNNTLRLRRNSEVL